MLTDKQINTLIREYKKSQFAAEHGGKMPTAKQLADDYGLRIRRAAEAKRIGESILEISTGYFYKSQNHNRHHWKQFDAWLQENHKLTLVLVSWCGDRLTEDDMVERQRGISFETKPWPMDSWAVSFFLVEAV